MNALPDAGRRDSGDRPPSWLLALIEAPRALSEAASLIPARGMLRRLPPGDGHPVMTLPGFLASGVSMRPMRRYLRHWGYEAHCWSLGRNLGLTPERDLERLLDERLQSIHAESGRKVSLVGWSLGGLIARELARRQSNLVRSVIALGSPFGNPRATNAWRLYELMTGTRLDDESVRLRVSVLREPLADVPVTAIYSNSDAIVAASIAKLPAGDRVENIGIRTSHFGMGFHPAVLYVIADRLRQPPDDWRPFEIGGPCRLFYY
jgi:pimeloyl-ACP methyl ester carboxylesterase